jgi:hypothetical protein
MGATARRLEALKTGTGIYVPKYPSVGELLTRAEESRARQAKTLERVKLVQETLRQLLRTRRIARSDRDIARFILRELNKALYGKRS